MKEKLTSRKFWVAVAAGAALWAEHRYPETAGVVIAWLTAQGLIDYRKAGTAA